MAASCQDCHTKCGKGRVSPEVLQRLECGFYNLDASDSNSLLRRHLTRCVFDKLKRLSTPCGGTLLDCINTGLVNLDSSVGVYACDPTAYTVFADLFDPIIEEYHMGFRKSHCQPPQDFGDANTLKDLDPTGNFVLSTRVRCGRALEGYPFNPLLTEHQYCEMERKVCETLCQSMTSNLKGRYCPLWGMDKEVQQQLIDDHYLFKEGDRFLEAGNATKFWPRGRGIYYNEEKTFIVWCNEEDHLRIISMQEGGNLKEIYKRMVEGVQCLEKRLKFVRNDHLGYLTFCPTNLGTTIRASVHIKLPRLGEDQSKLEEIAGRYNLQVRGTAGEHSASVAGVYDISNKRRLGVTEYQAVKEMQDGILELIKQEDES